MLDLGKKLINNLNQEEVEEPAQNKYGTAATARLIGQFGLNLVCKIIVVSGNCSFILCSYLQYFWPYSQKFIFLLKITNKKLLYLPYL